MSRSFGVENKATKHAQIRPTVRDLEWAAGFIEGEGCFSRLGDSEVVSVSQIEKEPVEKLLQLFGGSLNQRRDEWATHKRKHPIWVWRACGSRARGVMMTLYPLLAKRRQSQIKRAMNVKQPIDTGGSRLTTAAAAA